MYDPKKINEEAEAIVKAVLDRKHAALEKNYDILKSLPKPELMYWNMASQLDNTKRKAFDRRIYLQAEIKGLKGVKLIDMLNLAYENYLDQQKELGDKGNIGNDAAAAASDLEARTKRDITPGFTARETGRVDRDRDTGALVKTEKGLDSDFVAANSATPNIFGNWGQRELSAEYKKKHPEIFGEA